LKEKKVKAAGCGERRRVLGVGEIKIGMGVGPTDGKKG